MSVTEKSMARFSSRLVLFALLLTVGLMCWATIEHRRGLNRLRGPLSRIEIQFDSWGLWEVSTSPWQGKWVGTDDPEFLAKVEAWLRTLQRPPYSNALRQLGGRILLTFRDGRQEELLFRGPDRPGPSRSRCFGFIWDGLDIEGGEEPFTDFLRELRVEGERPAERGAAADRPRE
jgi:hypothetical protein